MQAQTLTRFAVPLFIWVPLAVLSTTQLYSIVRLENRDVPLWRIALWQSAVWLLWAALTPVVLWLGRRFPLERTSWRRTVPLHIFAGVLLGLLHTALLTVIRYNIPLVADMPQTLSSAIFSSAFYFHIHLLVYWAILGVASAFDFYSRWQAEQMHGVRLKEQLAQARLQALQMQLQPHFLFNTLHTIATLVEDEPRLARQMIARLGDFLRLTLQENGAEIVTLGRELEFARAYLSIEELRFQDRLTVRFSIAPETSKALVPYLILQPLIENAIRHGIEPSGKRGLLEVNARVENNQLFIEVLDDGGKFVLTDGGLGLTNTHARLGQIYGEAGRLTLSVDESGVTVAAIEIPFAT